VPFKEYDVGVDREAAMRMIHLSGQQGVPVITIDDQVVVGFDQRRLAELLAKGAAAKVELGAAVADATARARMDGAYVGRVKRGSLADKAGLKVKDVIVELNGQVVRNSADLTRIMAGLYPGLRPKLIYMRQGQRTQTELSI
jgi:S1-C subfamily serine protease